MHDGHIDIDTMDTCTTPTAIIVTITARLHCSSTPSLSPKKTKKGFAAAAKPYMIYTVTIRHGLINPFGCL